MSLCALTAIWKDPPCKQGELLCLLAIADNADETGYAWPSIGTIARKAAMSERGAQKAVKKLAESGLIRVQKGGGRAKTNAYQITTNGMGEDEKHKNPEQNTPNPSSPFNSVNPEQRDINPEQSDAKPRTPVHPNSKEPSLEPSGSPCSPPKRKSRLCEIPPDAAISDAMYRAADKRGHSQQEAEAQFQKFKASAIAKARRYANWDMAFVTWLDSEYFKPITTGGPQNGRQQFDTAHREYTRRVSEGTINRGPDPSNPFSG